MSHEFSGRIVSLGRDAGSSGKLGQAVTVNPLGSCGQCYECRQGLAFLCPKHPNLGLTAPGAYAEYTSVRVAQGSGGAIVNTSSQAGIQGGGRFSPYVASKHAVIGLSRSAALEGGAYGVPVNAVAPGFIDTRMLRDLSSQINAADPDGVYTQMASQVPLSRLGTADEVATLVTWLLSDESAYISGTTQVIDGALNA